MAERTGRTVVIGGGAAGIAAARRLWDSGTDVLLLEAGSRVGGRASSLTLDLAPASFPIPAAVTVDAGCGWLHSARRNPWTQVAEQTGAAIDRSSPNWGVQWRDLGYSPAEQQAFGEAWHRWETAARAAAGGPDQPLSAFIARDDRWRPMIDAISGYANGAPLTAVSLHDWLAYEDASTADNWALPAGYGTLIAGHVGSVPVRLGTLVTRIDHRGTALRIDTDAGTVEADQAIVCVPTTALAAIAFDPPLPGKHDAAAALPLGLADKVFLQVDRIDWPASSHLIGNPHSGCSASHRLSPFGWPIIESFFGGDCAEVLEVEGAAADFAITELVALLGADWRVRLTPLAATRWRHEPHIHGSYSHARVGHAGDRQILAAPVDDRLFFAGEACSREDFSTAHGAYLTGVAAAEAILAARSQGA
ncbi:MULTISPECIES: NAD(P)/FAD-dependent oxidoreductase [unclassified Sphingomonas]|uniref:flavin monoamine oxidase family protein n=1 Tax=unclassified Sphingomonas TaxID=196159 RepID=UPI00226AE5F2|nr:MULTISPECIES: NAD(P)/FAD-dependent oxidoreductase [unclassified Sphingomonas]